jgi:CRP-like cAMP-binding protein
MSTRVSAAETKRFLRNAPVLTGIPDEILERFVAAARERRVLAGEWLFREGDEATSLFVIRAGRLGGRGGAAGERVEGDAAR